MEIDFVVDAADETAGVGVVVGAEMYDSDVMTVIADELEEAYHHRHQLQRHRQKDRRYH